MKKSAESFNFLKLFFYLKQNDAKDSRKCSTFVSVYLTTLSLSFSFLYWGFCTPSIVSPEIYKTNSARNLFDLLCELFIEINSAKFFLFLSLYLPNQQIPWSRIGPETFQNIIFNFYLLIKAMISLGLGLPYFFKKRSNPSLL